MFAGDSADGFRWRSAHPTSTAWPGPKRRKNFLEKYNRFTMKNARQLQCKALCRLQKSRRRKNNGKQWKKQWAEQSEQSENPASAGSASS
jgi:hypothetical protein